MALAVAMRPSGPQQAVASVVKARPYWVVWYGEPAKTPEPEPLPSRELTLDPEVKRRGEEWMELVRLRHAKPKVKPLPKVKPVDQVARELAARWAARERQTREKWQPVHGFEQVHCNLHETILSPIDQTEDDSGTRRFTCHGCGRMSTTAHCRKCFRENEASNFLTREPDAEAFKRRINEFAAWWPEQVQLMINTDPEHAWDANREKWEHKAQMKAKFIARLSESRTPAPLNQANPLVTVEA